MNNQNDSFEEQKLEGMLREAVPSAGDAPQVSNGQLMFEMGRAVGMRRADKHDSGMPQSLRIWQGTTAASVMVASIFAVLLLQQWPGERNETIATSPSGKAMSADAPEISAANASVAPFEMTNAEVKLPSESARPKTRWLRSPEDRYDRLLATVAGETVFDSIVEPPGKATERRTDTNNRMLGPYQSVRRLLESGEL